MTVSRSSVSGKDIGVCSEGTQPYIELGIYGFELLLDLQGCDPELFNRPHINQYFTDLCELIEMEKCEVHFWDDMDVPVDERQTLPHAKGTSAVCFILTSSIVIHTLDMLEAVFVNIFSCKSFDPHLAEKFTRERFAAECSNMRFVERTLSSQHSRNTS